MAGAREDDLESKLGGMLLLDKKKLSSTKKSRFTWHSGTCTHQIELWENDPQARKLEERADKLLGTVREDYEVSMRIYDSIKTTTGVTEQ